jgi:hypothetical protein
MKMQLAKKPIPLLGTAVALATIVGTVGLGVGVATATSVHASGRTSNTTLSAPGTYTLHPGTLEGDTVTLTGGPTGGNLTMNPGGSTGFWFLDAKQITMVVQSGAFAGLVFEGKLKPKGINAAGHPGIFAAGGFGTSTWYGTKG